MRMPKHDHQPRDQPTRHDANFLDETLLDPEEQLIRLLKQAAGRHCTLPPAMPAQISLLLFNRLLKHGWQSTISAPHCSSSSCRVAQCSPSTGRRYEVDLSIECPLPPLLANPIAHHHPRHIAVRALVCLIGPTLNDFDADDLHVEQLDVVIQPRHIPHEGVAPSPRPLAIFRKQVPHLVAPTLCMKPHEAHL